MRTVLFFLALLVSLSLAAQNDDVLEGKILLSFSKQEQKEIKEYGKEIKKGNALFAEAEKLKSGSNRKSVKLHEKASDIFSENYAGLYELRKKKLDEFKEDAEQIKQTAFDFLYQEAVNSYRKAIGERVKAENMKNKEKQIAYYQKAKEYYEKAIGYQEESFAVFFDYITDLEKYAETTDYSEEAINSNLAGTEKSEITGDTEFEENSFSTDESYAIVKTYSGDTNSGGDNDTPLYNSNVSFKVQIAAAVTPIPEAELRRKYSGDDIKHEFIQNYHKYVIGNYRTYKDAYNAKKQSGVSGAFVVAYQDGKRVESMQAFKEIVPQDPEDMNLNSSSGYNSGNGKTNSDNNINTNTNTGKPSAGNASDTGTEYRLQIGISRIPASNAQKDAMNPTDLEVKEYKSSSVMYKYTVGSFSTEADAENYRNAYGLSKTIIVKYSDGKEIPLK